MATQNNAMADMTHPVRRVYYCSCCGRLFKDQPRNFYRCGSAIYRANNQYLTVCNQCVDALYDDYLRKYSDSVRAARRVCSMLDVYFNQDVFSSASVSKSKTAMSGYMTALHGNQMFVRTFDDTLYEMTVEGHVGTVDIADSIQDEVPSDVRQFWGDGLTKKQYDELQSCYDRWTNGKTLSGPDEIGLYRQIAIADWNVMNSTRKGQKIEQQQQVLNGLLSKTSVSEKRSAADDNRSVGEKIRDWEKERPVPEPAEEFRDVDGIVKYVSTWFRNIYKGPHVLQGA